jgi:hypothetical protein
VTTDNEVEQKKSGNESLAPFEKLIEANPGVLTHPMRPKGYSDIEWLKAVADARRLGYGGWK